MILSISDCKLEEEAAFSVLRYSGYEVFSQGVLFCRGMKAGVESICQIIDEYNSSGRISFMRIHGSFLVVLRSLRDGRIVLFSDNSNMRSFYIGPTALSDNYLALVKHEPHLSFDNLALCELFNLGITYFRKTPFSEIVASHSQNYYSIIDGRLDSHSKDIGNIDVPSSLRNLDDVDLYFRDIGYALSDYNTILDLTGGYDSRMVFAQLKSWLPRRSLFVSGDEYNPEVVISKAIGHICKTRVLHNDVPKPVITESLLDELFCFYQGMSVFGSADSIGTMSSTLLCQAKGFDLKLTGDGGVLYKDWWWLQDFPFYRSRNTDLDRFFRQRISILKNKYGLSSLMISTFQDHKRAFVAALESFRCSLNTETYDQLYYNVAGSNVAWGYNASAAAINAYAPLLELDLVRYSYALPRLDRFYNNFQRAVITRSAPEISAIRTIYGTNCSSAPSEKLFDLLFFLRQLLIKVLRLSSRKLLNKNVLQGSAITWSSSEQIRKLGIAEDALKVCQRRNLLAADVDIDRLPDETLYSALLVFMLSQFREKYHPHSMD